MSDKKNSPATSTSTKTVRAQCNGHVTINGSAAWPPEAKARFLAGGRRRIVLTINGQTVHAVCALSKSKGSVTAAFAVALDLGPEDLALGTAVVKDAATDANDALAALLADEK